MIEITSDLDRLGYMELNEAVEILKAYIKQRPEFLGEGTRIYFNEDSGIVFIADNDYNVALLNDDGKLEQQFFCSECGYEDFREDFIKHAETQECKQAVADALNEDISTLYPDAEKQNNANSPEEQGLSPASDIKR